MIAATPPSLRFGTPDPIKIRIYAQPPLSLQSALVSGPLCTRRKSFLGTRVTIRRRILQKLLPVPEEIRIEADEFVFTIAAREEVEVLPEALLYYRLHQGNFYSQRGFNEQSVKRKQQSIAYLAEALEARLKPAGVCPEAVEIVVKAIRTEADQLRLSVDGGLPWETVKTELAMYQLLHKDAAWTHRIFKYTTPLRS